MRKTILALIMLSFCIYYSCENDGDDTIEERVLLSIEPTYLETFSSGGGSQSVNITSDKEGVQWSAKESDKWITLVPTANSLTVNVGANDGQSRSGTIVVSAENSNTLTLTVNQLAKDEKLLEAYPLSIDFRSTGGEKSVRINADCEYEVLPSEDWLQIKRTDHGFNLTVSNYILDQSRTGEIRVRSEEVSEDVVINVTQSAKEFLKADRDEINFESEGGTEVIKIESNVRWWAVDKEKTYDWLTIDQQDDRLLITASKNNDIINSRDAVIEIEAEFVDQSIEINIFQKNEKPYLSLDIERIDLEWNSAHFIFNITSNSPWTISWEDVNDPEGRSPSSWFDNNWWGKSGDHEALMVFNHFYPHLSTDDRTAVMVVTSESIDEPVRIPFRQTGMPQNTARLTSIEDLLGQWQVTGEIIKIGDDIYANDHIVTVNKHPTIANLLTVENVTNINAYPSIGGVQFKGDSAPFMVDLQNSTISLSSSYRVERTSYVNIGNNWGLDSRATATLMCAMLHEDVHFIIANGTRAMRFPLMFIDVKEDGRHEIELTFPDYALEHNGKTYYGSSYAYGDYSPIQIPYASTYGTKWIKIP